MPPQPCRATIAGRRRGSGAAAAAGRNSRPWTVTGLPVAGSGADDSKLTRSPAGAAATGSAPRIVAAASIAMRQSLIGSA
jgi:hypothetical protein